MIHNILKDKSTRLFLILGGFFIANVFIAEIIGVKIFSLEKTLGFEPLKIRLLGNDLSVNLTAGVLLWPVVFIMTDLINELRNKCRTGSSQPEFFFRLSFSLFYKK